MRLFYYKLWTELKPPTLAMREAQLALYYRPENIDRIVQTRGPDFGRKLDLAAIKEPPATPVSGRAPLRQWAAFTISGPPPANLPVENTVRVVETADQRRKQQHDAEAHVRLGIAFHQDAKLSGDSGIHRSNTPQARPCGSALLPRARLPGHEACTGGASRIATSMSTGREIQAKTANSGRQRVSRDEPADRLLSSAHGSGQNRPGGPANGYGAARGSRH